jgi:high affinity sulfate transporter 1
MATLSERKVLPLVLPVTNWLPSLSGATIRMDLVAGLALAGLLVPEGLAYAGIAGVPPEVGLYSLTAGLFVYALFGSSRQLAVSCTSGSAAMLAAIVAPLASGDATRYVALASATAIAAGLLFLLAGAFRLGFVSEFISKPVLKGFVFGIALTIMVKQAPKLLGIEKGSGNILNQLWHVVKSLPETNVPTFIVGGSAIAVLFVLGSLVPRVPSALVVFVAGILVVQMFGLDRHGVEVVGNVPAGLPHLSLPSVSRDDFVDLLTSAIGIVLIVYAEALAAARTFASKYKYDISPNQELVAIGMSNLASGLTQGIIVGGGMSGTAANASGGARTPISVMTTAMVSLLTLLFLMPLFKSLPEAVLGAIVIHAIWHLADVKEMRRLASLKTGSIWAALTALAGVLAFGILKGLILAMCLTLITLLKKVSAPEDSVLGKLPGTNIFVDKKFYPEAEPVPGLLIFRPNGLLFFANANRVRSHLLSLLKETEGPVHDVIISLESSPEIDATSVDMLDQLRSELSERGISLKFARVSEPVRDLFRRSGFIDRVGEANIYYGVHRAVAALGHA